MDIGLFSLIDEQYTCADEEDDERDAGMGAPYGDYLP
jgi:hypothetical protein